MRENLVSLIRLFLYRRIFMSKPSKKPVEIIKEGPYRSGSTMFCQMLLIMLPVFGLIYGITTYYKAKDQELKSLCMGMVLVRAVAILFYLLFFVFILKICMRIAILY